MKNIELRVSYKILKNLGFVTMIDTNLGLEEIIQKITDQAPNINADRKIPDQLIDEMTQKKLFKLLVPKTYGGEEINYLKYLFPIDLTK